MTMEEVTDRQPPARHYGLDWLRIGAFGLLIFYHIGMFFAPGEWLVKAPRMIEAVAWPMLAVQPWRMPLLFVVSGYASYALLAKTGDTIGFLRARSSRLLVPFAFAMLFIVPPQTWISFVERGYQAEFLHFWTHEWFVFGTRDGTFLPSPEHLWFIAYLWTYTMLLGGMTVFAPASWKATTARMVQTLAIRRRLLWLPLLPLLVIRIVLLFTVPERHGLLHDWVSDSLYIPAFLFGFALAGTPELWPAVRRCARPALLLALVAYGILLIIEIWLPDGIAPRSHMIQALQRDASLVMAWSMILLLLGLADRWLNRDHPLRARLSEVVFPFYIVHQTIIVVVGWWIRDSAISAAAMFAVLVAATLGGCWLFYELGRQVRPLRPLIGLSPMPARTTTATGGAAKAV